MRKLIFIQLICFSFYFQCYSQGKTLFKAWSGKDLNYIKIDSNRVYFEISGSFSEEKRYFILGDTLRLYDKYTSSRDNYAKYHIDNFDFLIKRLNPNKLILMPLDSNAKELSKGRDILDYNDRSTILDKNFKFNQLKYKLYGGGWGWSDISMLIDNEKNFHYIDKSNRKNPLYCYGKLPDEKYNELIKLLKSSQIDKLRNFEQHVYDVPETTLEIEYNGKTKQIKQYILPLITTELMRFIEELPKKTSLTSKEPFQIKFKPQQ